MLITHQKNGTTIDGASYLYDSAGNRTSRTPLPGTAALTFGYDNIYQLKTAKLGTTTKESYTYSAVGNRLTSLAATNWMYNSSNELNSVGGTNYNWDNNGNLTSRVAAHTATYTWDFENRMVQLTQFQAPTAVTFKYDPFGRRIYKSSSSGTSIYVYDGDNQIEEVNASGTAVARYTQGLGIDEPLAMLRGPTTDYYQADGLGSITSLTDSTGAVAATYAYESYGASAGTTGTITNPFQYTARELDPETAWYYYRARYYAPVLGRFLSEDPIRWRGSGANFYPYGQNSPTNYNDPFGKNGITFCVGGYGKSFFYNEDGLSPTQKAAEQAHEAVHRANCGSSLPPWKDEQQAFGAEIPVLSKRISELQKKKCLTRDEMNELAQLMEFLQTAEHISQSDQVAKDYWNNTHPYFWQPKAK